jgi:hypothetical protein
MRNKPAPDRTRRITTRFSLAEERRIGKCAAELGITVSSYLRQCALSSVTQKPLPEAPAPTAAAGTRKPPARAQSHRFSTRLLHRPCLVAGLRCCATASLARRCGSLKKREKKRVWSLGVGV